MIEIADEYYVQRCLMTTTTVDCVDSSALLCLIESRHLRYIQAVFRWKQKQSVFPLSPRVVPSREIPSLNVPV